MSNNDTNKLKNAPSIDVPEPRSRPGDAVDFSHIEIPQAGILKRPPTNSDPKEIIDYSFSLIRVLDNENNAVGDWNPNLDVEVLKTGLFNMMKTRIFDDQVFTLQRTGRISFYMKSAGEEAISVAQTMALRSSDMMFPSYRQQGILITKGLPYIDMVCQCFNNTKDNLKGHQLPILYSWKEHNFFTISGNLGTQYPQAVGWAMANAYKGSDDIAVSWVGDGTTAEGDVHSALTFASVYKAPVIFNITNNQWAISSFQGIAGGLNTTFASKGIGYGLPGLRVDGNDFLAVYAATEWAAERARNGHGATVIELFTYRAEGHSTSDDPSKYRPVGEAEQWPLGDPIERLKGHLINLGAWTQDEHVELAKQIKKDVRTAMKDAEAFGTMTKEPRLSPSVMFDDVFEELPPHLIRQRQELGY